MFISHNTDFDLIFALNIMLTACELRKCVRISSCETARFDLCFNTSDWRDTCAKYRDDRVAFSITQVS